MKGGFRPGGGRPKGSKGKRGPDAVEIAERLGINPFEVLLMFAKGDWQGLGYASGTVEKIVGKDMVISEPTISPELRSSSAAKACEFIFPKKRAVEHDMGEETITEIVRTVFTKSV